MQQAGGPGSSGTAAVRSLAPDIFNIFGENFNLIGFDPRGVNNSGPTATCFPGTAEDNSRTYESLLKMASTNGPLQEVYSRAKALGEHCTLVNTNKSDGYIGTSAVAQDMKYFIELQAKSSGKSAVDAKLWYYRITASATAQSLNTLSQLRIPTA
jgi:hypothetical protein